MPRNSFDLLLQGRDVVVVDMGVAKDVDEVARLHLEGVSYEDGKEGVGGNVEWDAKTNIGRALVKLRREMWDT